MLLRRPQFWRKIRLRRLLTLLEVRQSLEQTTRAAWDLGVQADGGLPLTETQLRSIATELSRRGEGKPLRVVHDENLAVDRDAYYLLSAPLGEHQLTLVHRTGRRHYDICGISENGALDYVSVMQVGKM